MINQYTITSDAWTQITQPGETGTCWLDDDNEQSGDKADVRIWHTSGVAPGADEITKAKRVIRPSYNDDVLTITADSATDVFYARCKNSGESAILSVDVI